MSALDERLFRKTLCYEGVLSDDAQDQGGLTKYGISQKQYPDLDILHLTLAQAQDIYCRDYYRKLPLQLIPDLKLQWKLFDIAVNMGVFTAIRFLQKTIQVDDDGCFGKQSEQALQQFTSQEGWQDKMMNSLIGLQTKRYNQIVQRNPSQMKFLKGWLKRAADDGAGIE